MKTTILHDKKKGLEGLIEKINSKDFGLYSCKANNPDGSKSLGCIHVQVACLKTSFSEEYSIGTGCLCLSDFVYDQDLKDSRYKRFKTKESAIEYLKTICK